jgi:ATP-binding cassette subfamily F protein 3
MLQVSGLSKSYSGVTLFSDISFSVGRGEIIGLVGRNGSGKTTLIKIILGLEGSDSGTMVVPKGYRLGYLDQHISFTKSTLLEECCQVLAEDERYDYYKAEKILFGLGFVEADLTRPPAEFSGGFQLRINLTKTLLKNPDLLLLDEPTNYLDILSLRWLRSFLKSFRGEAILITHDRGFLDTVTTHTMGIHRGRLMKTKGQSEKYYAQLELESEVYEKTRKKQVKKVKEMQNFVDRFGAKATKAAQAKSVLRRIGKMTPMNEMTREQSLGFRFNYKPVAAKALMQVEDIAFSYPDLDPLFNGLSFRIGPEDRIAVIGRNGKGKTTLLNVLSGKAAPTAGAVRLHPGAAIGYYQQTNLKDLDPKKTVAAEIADANSDLSISASRGICGAMMFSGDLADKKISVLSGGEQSRVLLGKILAHPANLLLLDEPSNHLDMDSIEVMTGELTKFPGPVVIVTHNEEMLRRLANKLVIFHEGRAEFFAGTYDEFLDTIGWEEEMNLNGSKTVKKGPKLRAASSAKKQARKVSALKKKYGSAESEILTLEKELELKNAEAERMALEGPRVEVSRLYKLIGGLQEQLDGLYTRLEELSAEIDGL